MKFKATKSLTAVTLMMVLVAGTAAKAQDAREILENMDRIMLSPKDKQGTVKVILTDKTGKEKIREASMIQKGPEKKLYRYTKPESQAGMATLSLTDDIMWVYMPAFGKPKKISMANRSQNSTGTDFSYEDMSTSSYASRYTPELTSSDDQVYTLSLTPAAGKSDYSKIVVKIDRVNGYPVSMEYYDTKGTRFKEATYKYEKVGKYWNATEVLMKDFTKNHSTRILITDVKFDQGLSDDLFTVEKLMPGA